MKTRYGRSLARIDRNDLPRLAKLAADVEAGLFARHPHGAGRYAGRLVCRALCQGAALHYLDEKNGVKDFDVWSFYAARGSLSCAMRTSSPATSERMQNRSFCTQLFIRAESALDCAESAFGSLAPGNDSRAA